jgi:anti-sigma regulatory factor (Ser/Thr protein kinase)
MGPLTRHAQRQSSHQRFIVTDHAAVGAVRRAVGDYADRLRAGSTFAAVAANTATELANNLLFHADSGGWILTRPLPPAGVEILAVDRGPGIRDVAAAVAGRAPSPKGLGCGLAAVRNASSQFDIHTHPDRGTVILSVVEAGRTNRSGQARPPRRWAGVSIGIDEACGDGWAVLQDNNVLTAAVVDGLGQGDLVDSGLGAVAVLGSRACR